MKRLALVTLALFTAPVFAQPAGKSVAEIVGVREPSIVQRTMLSPTPEAQQLPDLIYLGGYEVIGKPAELSPKQSAQLAALLKDPASFNDGEMKRCGFRPGVAFRCGSGAEAIDLLVCFSCNEVALVPFGKGIIETTGFPQASRDVLLTLTKILFPADEGIQALPKVRSDGVTPPPPAPVPGDVPRAGGPPPAK